MVSIWSFSTCCLTDIWSSVWWNSSPTEASQVSHLRRIHNGVPQGSTLAPTLFNIYISDIPQTTSKQYGYVDDLALLAAHHNWEKVEEILNQDMQSLSEYTWAAGVWNWTSLRIYDSFPPKLNRDTHRQRDVVVNCAPLPNNKNPVYLDVTLDRALTYRKHLESLQSKVNARNGLLRCLASSSWGAYTQESAICTCGHTTQPVQHMVVDGMIHKSPAWFAGLRRPNATTTSWLEDLNIEIWRTSKRLYISSCFQLQPPASEQSQYVYHAGTQPLYRLASPPSGTDRKLAPCGPGETC